MIQNVLLVDDDPFCNRMNSFILEQHVAANAIKTYENAVDALQYLNELIQAGEYVKFPDLILLDLHMSYMDGWGFLDKFAELPVSYKSKSNLFILTSSIQPSDREKAVIREDVSGYIEKPFTVSEMDYVLMHCQAHQPS